MPASPSPTEDSSAEPDSPKASHRRLWALVGILLVFGAGAAAIIATSHEAGSKSDDHPARMWTGSADCSVTDKDGAISIEGATLSYSQGNDLTVEIRTTSPVPNDPNDPMTSTENYTLFGHPIGSAMSDTGWRLDIYKPLRGPWEARLGGDIEGAAPDDYNPTDPSSDLYLGDPDAVSVSGSTVTARWPFGEFRDARDRDGNPLTVGRWSVQGSLSEGYCAGGKPDQTRSTTTRPSTTMAPKATTTTAPATTLPQRTTTAPPSSGNHPTLAPATVPSAVPVCDEPLATTGIGFPTGDCADGIALNRRAWDYYATTFGSILSLGPAATEQQISDTAKQALDTNMVTGQSGIWEVVHTAARYYGWEDSRWQNWDSGGG